MRRRATRVTVSAIAVLLAGCGGDSGPTTTAATVSTEPATTVPATTSTAAAVESPTRIALTIADGKVSGDTTTQVAADSTVELAITSDTADTVHVHGYDKEITLSAGTPAVLTFVADIPGRFEIETHEGGLVLMTLTVK